jgi:hypothetical protein
MFSLVPTRTLNGICTSCFYRLLLLLILLDIVQQVLYQIDARRISSFPLIVKLLLADPEFVPEFALFNCCLQGTCLLHHRARAKFRVVR